MKRLFLILLLATSVVLYNACGPFEFPGYDEGGDGDNTEEPTPTPNPDPTPKPDPTPDPKPDDKLVTATLTYDAIANGTYNAVMTLSAEGVLNLTAQPSATYSAVKAYVMDSDGDPARGCELMTTSDGTTQQC